MYTDLIKNINFYPKETRLASVFKLTIIITSIKARIKKITPQ